MTSRTEQTPDFGLRTLAVFEASKGALVLAVGLGLLSLVHKNVESLAQELIRHLHLNPARHYPRILLQAASSVTDSRLWILAILASLYSTARFVEGYGLWYGRRWAE